MPLIQPMRRPAGTGRLDPACPAAHFPVPTQDAIGDRLVTPELDMASPKHPFGWDFLAQQRRPSNGAEWRDCAPSPRQGLMTLRE